MSFSLSILSLLNFSSSSCLDWFCSHESVALSCWMISSRYNSFFPEPEIGWLITKNVSFWSLLSEITQAAYMFKNHSDFRTFAELVALNLIPILAFIVVHLLLGRLDVDAVWEVENESFHEFQIIIVIAQRWKLFLAPIEIAHDSTTNVYFFFHRTTLRKSKMDLSFVRKSVFINFRCFN